MQDRKAPIVSQGNDMFQVNLLDAERTLIANLMKELSELVESDPKAEMLTRLFPTALPNDPEAEEEFQQMVLQELITTRVGRFSNISATAKEVLLDREQLEGWMAAINDARLVLGTRLDVCEADDFEELDEDDPNALAQSAYWFFGWLLEHIVTALAADI